MTPNKRPEGTCKDCWATWLGAHAAWQALAAATREPGVDLAWDLDHPEPKLPKRPAPWPGPRCTTCDRAWKKAGKLKSHARRTEANFGIPADLYWALYEFQGGKCAILHCRATGKTKALAVDHDHRCCPGRTSCGKCVRGLLCGPHNEQFGRNGDDPAVFRDMADYLELSTMDRFRMRADLRDKIHRFAVKNTADSFALERGPQGKQLDRDTSTGSVQQELGPVRRHRPDPAAIDPVAWQGIRPAGDN